MTRTLLIIATILLVLNTLWGLYMRTRIIPTWFSNLPKSLAKIQTKAPKGWVPLQIAFAVSFIAALVITWDNGIVRTYMLLTLLCYIIIGVSTGTYFLKEILAFSKMGEKTTLTPELQKRAGRWQTLTTGRNVVQVLSAIFLIIACTQL